MTANLFPGHTLGPAEARLSGALRDEIDWHVETAFSTTCQHPDRTARLVSFLTHPASTGASAASINDALQRHGIPGETLVLANRLHVLLNPPMRNGCAVA